MLVIIHGWSDTSASFRSLARWLVAQNVAKSITNIRLGDYLSLDDDVTFDDLSTALHRAWVDAGLSVKPRQVDVLVHSTGGLIVRHWMTRFYEPETVPIRRLLMLAPANFGSPLAHKGRSLIGRVVKGFGSEKKFNTGTHILRGLEMASPFSSDLAERDLLTRSPWYGPGGILATVLVGTAGYSGIRAVANSPGSDGTVYVASANLNAARLTLDFATDPKTPRTRLQRANAITAFARLSNENHTTIIGHQNGAARFAGNNTATAIHRALTITDKTFEAYAQSLDHQNTRHREEQADEKHTHSYQNTVVSLRDNHNALVDDYFVELFAKRKTTSRSEWAEPTERLQSDVITKVHPYRDAPAHRSLLMDCTELSALYDDFNGILCLCVSASPEISETDSVGYRTFNWHALDSVKVSKKRASAIFSPDRTLLMDIKIRREQRPQVFRIR